MKTFASWAIGIISTFAVMFLFDWIGHLIHIQTWIDFGGPVQFDRFDDDERWGVSTDFGFATMVLSIMVGFRFGIAFYKSSVHNHLTTSGKIEFNSWFIGVAALTVTTAILDFTFQGAHSALVPYVKMAIVAGVATALFHRLSRRRSEQLRALEKDTQKKKAPYTAAKPLAPSTKPHTPASTAPPVHYYTPTARRILTPNAPPPCPRQSTTI